MASVRLGIYEVEEYELPRVCMRCGATAVGYKRRRFNWTPPWVLVTFLAGVVPYFICVAVLTRRASVRVPYCAEHKKGPLWPTLVSAGTFFGLLVVAAGLLVALHDEPAGFGGVFCFGAIGFLVWAFAAVIIHTPAIRPTEITDKSITLKGVSEEFIDALNDARRGHEDEDDADDRPRKRRRADGDDGGYYDPDARRGRRRGDHDEDER